MSIEAANECSTRGFHRFEDHICRDCSTVDERDGNLLIPIGIGDISGTTIGDDINAAMDRRGLVEPGTRIAVTLAVAWGQAQKVGLSKERFKLALANLLDGKNGVY
jgi:hypothetical protein